MKLKYQRVEIPFYVRAFPYAHLIKNEAYCLFESSEIDARYGRVSLLAFDPIFEVVSERDALCLRLTNRAFQPFLREVAAMFKQEKVLKQSNDSITISFRLEAFQEEENKRFRQANPAQILPLLLQKLPKSSGFCGLYGAMASTFIYQFEDILTKKTAESPDFRFHLYSKVLVFNHLTEEIYIDSLFQDGHELNPEFFDESLYSFHESNTDFAVGKASLFPEREIFYNQILQAKEEFKKGNLMELVLSRKLEASFAGNPFDLYTAYKEKNPSPYLFFMDFKDEQLIGASPEIMVKSEGGLVELKPISGTVRRGADALEDHEALMHLLNSPKEKAELDMLIDLGRNDLAKVCEPGIKLEAYRQIEKYSHLIHTVARLSGKLRPEFTGFEALVACLNAGTLTGAPKPAALQKIEDVEEHGRGYYGGCVGYLLPNGDVNTAITIRTAHIKNGCIQYLAGATLLADSDPDSEIQEVENKMAAFVETIKTTQDAHV